MHAMPNSAGPGRGRGGGHGEFDAYTESLKSADTDGDGSLSEDETQQYHIVYGRCPVGMVASAGSCVCRAGFGGQVGGGCSLCALGKYKASIGFGECSKCPAGTYGSLMNVPAGGPSSCQTCPTGSNTSVPGSSQAQCDCKAGYVGSFWDNATSHKPFIASMPSYWLPSVPSWRTRRSTWVVIESMIFPSSLQDAMLFIIGGSLRAAWAGIRTVGGTPVFRVRAGYMSRVLEAGQMHEGTAFVDISDFPRDDKNHSLAIYIRVRECRVSRRLFVLTTPPLVWLERNVCV